MGQILPVPAFFCLRMAAALFLLKMSANFLPVSGFALFSQFVQFGALLNLLAVGGAQNGLIRQAAAARDADELARTQTAALAIWGGVAALSGLVVALGGRMISKVLVGAPGDWPTVCLIAALALGAAPGQIWCSLLTGRKRIASSLSAQALGLLAGTAGAAACILRGLPLAAAVAFAAGPLATMAAAFALSHGLRPPLSAPPRIAPQMRTLLRYSAAFAATTAFSSTVLFTLRSEYRGAFGTTALGYWIAANRVSDMSTQLLGLFMIQFFVPHLAMAHGPLERRRLLVRCWAAAAGALAAALALFSAAAGPLIHLLLSDAYLPAVPVIRTYMLGDVLRVWPSLAMYTAFALGRPARYAGVEMGAMSLMAAVTLGLIAAGDPQAPQLGYLAAYAVCAVAVSLAFLWRAPALQAA